MAQEFYMKISSVIEDVIRNKQHKIYKVSSSHTKIVQVMVSKDVISEWTHRYDFSIFIVCSSVLLRSTDDVHQDDCRWLLCMAIKKTPIQKLQYLWNGMRRLNSSSFGHVPISRIYQQYPALHHWQLHMTCFKVSTLYATLSHLGKRTVDAESRQQSRSNLLLSHSMTEASTKTKTSQITCCGKTCCVACVQQTGLL